MTEAGELAGLIDEEDLLTHVYEHGGSFDGLAENIMAKNLKTLGLDASKDEVMGLLRQGFVVPIVEGGKFYGLITKIDMLNYIGCLAREIAKWIRKINRALLPAPFMRVRLCPIPPRARL